MNNNNWYDFAIENRDKEVLLSYRSLSNHTHIQKGKLLIPSKDGIELRVKTYMPNNGSYILCVSYDRIISIQIQREP